MATVPTVTNIAAGAKYSTTGLNQRFQTLANAFANVVGVDGTNTTMTGDLDMDSQEIKNLGAPTTTNSAARLKDIQDASDSNINSAVVDLRADLGTNTTGLGSDAVAVVGSANNLTNYLAYDVVAASVAAVGNQTIDNVILTNSTLNTPTVTNLANMDHLHDTESNGGVLTSYAKWTEYTSGNTGTITLGTTYAVKATVNVGTVVANSKYMLFSYMNATAGTNTTNVGMKINTNASTNATVTFTEGAQLEVVVKPDGGSAWNICASGLIRVTANGVLVLDFYGKSGNVASSSGKLWYDIVRLY